MIQPSDFLTASAALAALALAIFVFVFPKTKDILDSRLDSIRKLDVPETVRKDKRFRLEVYLDGLLMYVVSFASIILSFFFFSILLEIVNLYLELPLQLGLPIPVAFRYGVMALGLLIWILISASLLILFNKVTGSKSLPVLIRSYAEITLGRKGESKVTHDLISNSKKLVKSGKSSESILHSTAGLEYEIRRRFDITEPYSFTSIVYQLADSRINNTSREQIMNLIALRERAAHQSDKPKITRKDARDAAKLVSNLISVLSNSDIRLLYDEIKYFKGVGR